MKKAISHRRGAGAAAAATLLSALLLAGVASAVRADVKIVQQQTAAGGAEVGVASIEPKTRVLYLKGDRMRMETKGGLTEIYDCATDRMYTLNPATKKYAVMSLEQSLLEGEGGGFLRQITVEGKAEMTEGGSTSVIGKQRAKNYILGLETTLRAERTGAKVMTLKIEGEQWVAESLSYPARCRKMFKAAFSRSAAQFYKAIEPLYDKMFGVNGLPLSSDMTLTVSAVAPNGETVDSLIEFRSEVKSISTAKLPDSLFNVPKGYKLVDAAGLK